jgi:hypothetical protein
LKEIVRNPVYATGVGLLQYGLEREKEMPGVRGTRWGGAYARLKNWMNDNF